MLGGFAGLAPVFDVGDWLRRGWTDVVLGYDASRQRRKYSMAEATMPSTVSP